MSGITIPKLNSTSGSLLFGGCRFNDISLSGLSAVEGEFVFDLASQLTSLNVSSLKSIGNTIRL